MLCGKTPFSSVEHRYKKDQIYFDIIKGEYTFPHFFSDNAKNLIFFFLQKKVTERLGYNGFS